MSLDNLKVCLGHRVRLNKVRPKGSNAKPVINTQSKKLQAVTLAPTVEIPNAND